MNEDTYRYVKFVCFVLLLFITVWAINIWKNKSSLQIGSVSGMTLENGNYSFTVKATNDPNTLNEINGIADEMTEKNLIEPDKYCSVCGKCLTYHGPDNKIITINGCFISFQYDSNNLRFHEFFKQAFSPYEPDKEYNICFGCFLKAMGVPEPNESKPNILKSDRGILKEWDINDANLWNEDSHNFIYMKK